MSSTEAALLLEQLETAGIELSIQSGHLAIRHYGPPPSPDILDRLKAGKQEIMALLQQPYPLSSQQQRIWFLCQTVKDPRAYYISQHFSIGQSLDPQLVSLAFESVIRRHDILRTIFLTEDGTPLQKVLPDVANGFSIDIEFTQQVTPENLQQWTDSIMLELASWPLFRIRVLQTEKGECVLSFVIHHIICDALSLQNLFREAIDIYYGHPKKEFKEKNDPPGQYRQTVARERAIRRSPEYDTARNYWLTRFAVMPAPLVLPYRGPRPAIKTFVGDFAEFRIPDQIVRKFRQKARLAKCTLFSALFTAVASLLKRYSGQETIILGTSVADQKAALYNQIGLFAQTLVVDVTIGPEDKFWELTAKAADTIRDGLAHLAYPFEMLVQERYGQRDISRSPFFDVMIDYFSNGDEPAPIPAESIRVPTYASKFDLTFTFHDDGKSLKLSLEYNTLLFEAALIYDLGETLQNLLDAAVEFPTAPVDSLQILSAANLETLLAERNTRETWQIPNGATLRNLVSSAAEKYASRIAMYDQQSAYSFSWLDNRSARLATYLKPMLPQEGQSIVAIWIDNSPESLVALWGVIKTGHIFLPIDINQPKERLSWLLEDSKAAALLTTADRIFDLPVRYKGRIIAVDIEPGEQDLPEWITPVSESTDATAYVIYTSGSTGTPKGVCVTQQNLLHYLHWAGSAYYNGLTASVVPWFTSIAFDLTITTLFTPLLNGMTIEIFRGSNTWDHLSRIAEGKRKYGLAKLTPSHIELLGLLERPGFPVDTVICGGEELTQRHVDILREANPEIIIYNEYGPTETTVGCAVERVSNSKIPHGIGVPAPFAGMYIVNSQLQPAPVDAWGEIVIAGKGVSQGYFGNPSLTAARFTVLPATGERIYRSGDRGRKRRDGTLECSGRLDDQIKFNGHRIEPGEIEQALMQLPGIRQTAVILHALANGNKELIAFYTTASGVTPQQVRAHLLTSLLPQVVPNQIILVESLPLTINGKIDKPQLLAIADKPVIVEGRQLPSTPTGIELTEYFEQLLGSGPIGIHENLFTRGLDSLKAIKAQSDLDKRFPGAIEIFQLFSYPTIEQLSQLISKEPQLQQPGTPEIIEF